MFKLYLLLFIKHMRSVFSREYNTKVTNVIDYMYADLQLVWLIWIKPAKEKVDHTWTMSYLREYFCYDSPNGN